MLHHHVCGPPSAPLLILGPSLGTSAAVWRPHLDGLAAHRRVVRFDLPGHGGSPTDLLDDPRPGRTTVADLARLVLELADHHGHDRFDYAGISLGAAIGAHLAVHRPERVASLGLVCTSAHFGTAGAWRERADLVRREGLQPLLETSPGRWFADPAAAGTAFGRELLRNLADADPASYAACCDGLAAYDLRSRLGRITAPTLVVGGTHDVATPPEHARELAEGIPSATLLTVEAGHLAVEEPARVAAALSAHLRNTAA